ncbi:hypothetical protein STRCI_000035 [Streptomyces cinnabarinus]|uniref:Uncharacterized protein n=1 Tax=Streptomyces cinnabarinus TaxID=67287 RepID=A0ABY7K8F1_9ACTN|nr:hypothetical protein [Streptomyces cinnabarinus]WAZ19016.1 hypothetical protein STRCI_000035 [Streptomyces cinnabarinus]
MTDSGLTWDALVAARAAKERFADELLAHPDVHGIGVGRRRRADQKVDEYAVVVHVERKLPLERVSEDRRLPQELRLIAADGREVVARVDVQERAKPVPENAPAPAGVNLGGKERPVPGGMSAGNSGTLGGWVWDTVTNQAVALSNRHVFGSVTGKAISQPSRDDGGRLPVDLIGSVLRAGSLDAAVAAPVDPAVVSASIIGGGPAVFGIADATLDMRVQKTGRTTGRTFGIVDLIDYDSGHSGSHADMWIDGDGSDFSDIGDSGALYMEAGSPTNDGDWRRVVGLHWGGAGNDGVGHHIRAVFDDLGLTTL